VHQPVSLELSDYQSKQMAARPQVQVTPIHQANIALPLKQDPYLKHRYTGTFWPRQAGWHQVEAETGPEHYFYIYPDSSWQEVGHSHTLKQTWDRVLRQAQIGTVTEPVSRKEPISPLGFSCSSW
jgi:hypothetical protein